MHKTLIVKHSDTLYLCAAATHWRPPSRRTTATPPPYGCAPPCCQCSAVWVMWALYDLKSKETGNASASVDHRPQTLSSMCQPPFTPYKAVPCPVPQQQFPSSHWKLPDWLARPGKCLERLWWRKQMLDRVHCYSSVLRGCVFTLDSAALNA